MLGRHRRVRMRANLLVVVIAVLLAFSGVPVDELGAEEPFVTVDRFVPHISSVSANQGERVGLFVREKVNHALSAKFASGQREGRALRAWWLGAVCT